MDEDFPMPAEGADFGEWLDGLSHEDHVKVSVNFDKVIRGLHPIQKSGG